jgi:uncharacterized membrane protein (DUF485 family)
MRRWWILSTDERPKTPSAVDRTAEAVYVAVENSDEFGALRKTFRGFVFPMTVAFFLWYALYVLLSAYARGFMGTKIIGNINVALVFGLLQFVTTFAIAWLYARFARKRLDPPAAKIKAEVESRVQSTRGAGA